MAQPSFTAPTPANKLVHQLLLASTNIGVFLDLSTKIEGQVTARVSTSGAVTTGSYTKNEGYQVYGSTTLNGGVSAGNRDLVVSASTGMASGTKLFVDTELRTVLGVNGLNIQIDALQSAHSNGAAIYVVESQPSYPGTNSLGGTVNTSFSRTTFLPTGQWVFVLSNTDVTNKVAIELSLGTIDSFS